MAFIAPLPCAAPLPSPGARRLCAARNRAARAARRAAPLCALEPGAGPARVGEGATTASFEARVALWREVEALKKSLTIAVNAQRFADAASLRDRIQALSLADEYVRTESELKAAVDDQRFADAARLRDALKTLDPPPGTAVLRGEQQEPSLEKAPMSDMLPEDVESWSKTKTNGIVVHVESYYMPEQSIPEQNRFLFGYKVSIMNESTDTCQLVSRHWVINSAGGPESEVKGPGVVGRQPVLEPGESFEYTSACPVTVPLQAGQSVVGNMRGKYHMCKGDTGDVKFSVDIDPFYFKLPFRNYRPSGPSPPRGPPWIKP